ncbi:MAG: UDP-2,3-diacylglucosamine diphosphatase LpxI [Defluviimonas sp.]|uniref:LpxI family protein n=1 Tax=Albidovulum sp. TaxID=1872424 RepID=UPI001DDD247E|nr:UDP-2,3-diacylglucosamine diphosphatase LpxI [Paracoccaceae bacterium]MCC0063915.1 UDP-2,3-diacylglucosamine diphosphatase LpxI [Defluviimonas sp.]
MSVTAVIAGQGALPALLVAALGARPHLVAEMEGCPADLPGAAPLRYRIERLVPFLDQLQAAGVGRVVFAGGIRRPRIEPGLIDLRTVTLVPRLVNASQKGDDAVLREVVAIFEDWGFEVVGADAILPDLVPGPGIVAGTVMAPERKDVDRAAEIVAALGALDIGQGAVVAGGLCLAVETLPGTDAMLGFVAAQRRDPGQGGARGVLYKAPKPGQDRRIDLPTLGPDTVRLAAAAGLAGIAWEAGGALLLDRASMEAEAHRAGLFLWARAP